MLPQTSNLANAVNDSLRALLNGGSSKKMDDFIDRLLAIAGQRSPLVVTAIDPCAVVILHGNKPLFEMKSDRAKAILRTLCARLSVRGRAWTGREISPYGDEIKLDNSDSDSTLTIRFENTSSVQQIDIENSASTTNGNSNTDPQANGEATNQAR